LGRLRSLEEYLRYESEALLEGSRLIVEPIPRPSLLAPVHLGHLDGELPEIDDLEPLEAVDL
jgi:hypothetical protein